MNFKKKTEQKYTQKRRRYRIKGGDNWYCRCDDITKSTQSPSPAPAQSQFASAKKPLADVELNTTPLVPPAIVTPPKPCNTFKGRKCPTDRCDLESKKAAVKRTGKLQKKLSINDLLCLSKLKGGYKSKKRSQIKKKKSIKPMLVIF